VANVCRELELFMGSVTYGAWKASVNEPCGWVSGAMVEMLLNRVARS
jgi:hypothetical protein